MSVMTSWSSVNAVLAELFFQPELHHVIQADLHQAHCFTEWPALFYSLKQQAL